MSVKVLDEIPEGPSVESLVSGAVDRDGLVSIQLAKVWNGRLIGETVRVDPERAEQMREDGYDALRPIKHKRRREEIVIPPADELTIGDKVIDDLTPPPIVPIPIVGTQPRTSRPTDGQGAFSDEREEV